MKFTKVIRSYMEKTLSEKRCAANKADPETQAYLNRKQHAKDEIRAIVDHARDEAQEVLDRYGLDISIRFYGDMVHGKERDFRPPHLYYSKVALLSIAMNDSLSAPSAQSSSICSMILF